MLKNIIANFLGKFWSVFSGFILVPLYIKILGFQNYAFISFTLILASFMAVFDAGLTTTLTREFSRSDKSLIDKKRVFHTLETIYIVIISFSVVLIFFSSNFIFYNWLGSKSLNSADTIFLIKIVTCEFGLQMLFRFYLGGILGFNKQVIANVILILWGIFRNGIVVFVVYFFSNLETYFIWQLVITLLFFIIIRLTILKILNNNYKFILKLIIEKDILINIWRFTAGILFISLIAAINTQMDKLAVSKLLGIQDLGFYNIAVTVSMSILIVVSPISVSVLPRLTSLYSASKNHEAKELFKKYYAYVIIVVFCLMANLMIYNTEIVWIWTANMNLANNASKLIVPLSFAYAMLAIATMPFDIAISNGYTKLNNILGLISLFITIPGYWIGIKSFGTLGAAYIFAFLQTIITLVYMYFINKKFLEFSFFKLVFIELLLPLILSIFIVYILHLLPDFFPYNRFLKSIWIIFSCCLTAIMMAIIFIPQKDLKNLFVAIKFNFLYSSSKGN